MIRLAGDVSGPAVDAGAQSRAAFAGRQGEGVAGSSQSPQATSEAAATQLDITRQQKPLAGADQLAEATAVLSLEHPAGGEAKARIKLPAGGAEAADAGAISGRNRVQSACPPHGAKVRASCAAIRARVHQRVTSCARRLFVWGPARGYLSGVEAVELLGVGGSLRKAVMLLRG